MTIGAGGDLWVSDVGAGRIDVFAPGGEFVKSLGSAVLEEPDALTAGPGGSMWVADRGLDKVIEFDESGSEIWEIGSEGHGEGQLESPAAVAVDAGGRVWVADSGNGRVEEFDETGAFLHEFGSDGEVAGRFAHPAALASDGEGHVWVAAMGNVEPTEEPGEDGTGEAEGPSAPGQDGPIAAWSLDEGEGTVAADATGHGHTGTVEGAGWTTGHDGGALHFDGSSGCVSIPADAELEPTGEFTIEAWVRPVHSEAEPEPVLAFQDPEAWERGEEQFAYELLAGGEGAPKAWARKAEEGGGYVGVYGSTPLPEGEWAHVALTDDDSQLTLYVDGEVVDTGTAPHHLGTAAGPLTIGCDTWGGTFDGSIDDVRIYGRALDEGEIGADEGRPVGSEGAAGQNWQIQRWGVSTGPSSEPVVGANPEVAFTHEDGEIAAVRPSQGPEQQYEYEGDLLTAHTGPEGEAAYEYDAHHRLSKVSLSDGASAEIAYESIGRVSAVTVTLPGEAAKTTHFEYSDEPRETIVRLPEEPAMVYDIGPDGSILRWHNVASPPEIESLSGSLWEQRGEVQSGTITPGDQNLLVHAHSPEGIASVKIIADGNQLVEEETCEQDYEKAGTECVNVPIQFVTDTEDWAPGILPLEVIVTDSLGHTESRRFWVNVPYTPPPPPEALRPPTFQATKGFREEYDLDPDLKGNKLALDERIFELINAWNDPNSYLGQVARASWERWGVPLRPVDVAELEYREWLYQTNSEKIDAWVEASQPANFAGYYLDNRAGGIMYVGFLGNQDEQLNLLKSSLGLVAPERVKVYQVAPTVSLLSARATAASVESAIEGSATLRAIVTSISLEKSGALVHVGAGNVALAESTIATLVPGARVVVVHESGGIDLLSGRYRTEGRMRAGDAVFAHTIYSQNTKCTAGFGTKSKVGEKNGQPIWRVFTLTAGHCNYLGKGQTFYRSTDADQENTSHWKPIGNAERGDYPARTPLSMDAVAIEARASGLVPQGQWGAGGTLEPTQPAGKVNVGETVCFSGITTQQLSCGPVTEITPYWSEEGNIPPMSGYWVKFSTPADHGDSGGPVWSVFGASVGSIEAKPSPGEKHSLDETFVEPLLTPPGLDRFVQTGLLERPAFAPMSMKIASDTE